MNPTKTEIGLVCQHILQRVNADIRKITGLKQWRKTQHAVDWFEGLENKKPSLYLGESEGSDGLHFSLCNPLDTLEGVWVCVEWDEMLDALKGSTTQAESMNAITQIKRVINQYEEWAKITHKEWLSLQD